MHPPVHLYQGEDRKARSTIKVPLLARATVFFIVSVAVGRVSAGRISFQVNSTGEGGDAFLGNGVCETASGNHLCTLRAAIQEGNANANEGVSITFSIPTSDPGYNAQTGASTISLNSALEIGKAARLELPTVSVAGPGASLLTVHAVPTQTARFRVFNVTTTAQCTCRG
jgi:hypothetical protein